MPKVPNAAIRVQQEEARHREQRAFHVRKEQAIHANVEDYEDITRKLNNKSFL